MIRLVRVANVCRAVFLDVSCHTDCRVRTDIRLLECGKVLCLTHSQLSAICSDSDTVLLSCRSTLLPVKSIALKKNKEPQESKETCLARPGHQGITKQLFLCQRKQIATDPEFQQWNFWGKKNLKSSLFPTGVMVYIYTVSVHDVLFLFHWCYSHPFFICLYVILLFLIINWYWNWLE